MNYQEIIKYAEAYMLRHQDPLVVQKYSRYFKAGDYDAYGVMRADTLLLAAEIEERYPKLDLDGILELSLLLYEHGKHELGTLANYLLERKRKDLQKCHFAAFKQLFDKGVKNWEHADQLCTHVLPHFLTQGIVPYTKFQSWIVASSPWTRRAAPVSMIKIKKTQELNDMLRFTEVLLTDSQRVVQQGMGWFLRELWWLHPQEIEDYLYQKRNIAARTIIQYATEHLSKEERLRFRRDKKETKKL